MIGWLRERIEAVRGGGELREGLRRMAQDAFHLEVNTIAKAGMTARKMPAPPHALLDICGKYYWYLLDRARAYELPAVAQTLAPLAPEHRRNGRDSFERIRAACGALLRFAETNDSLVGGDRVIIERIMRNAVELSALIERSEKADRGDLFDATRAELVAAGPASRDVKLPTDDLTLLRKIWDVGAETVLLQSLIGLDGNVVTRIHEDRIDAASKALRDLHLASTRTAIDTWSTVVKLLASLIHSLASIFAPGR